MHRLFVSAAIACCCFAAALRAADEPTMMREEVIRAADAVASEHADVKSYYRYEPSYSASTRSWGVNYRLRSPGSPQPSEGILSVTIDDATGVGRTRFWLASLHPSPQLAPRYSTRSVVHLLLLVGILVLLIWSLLRKRLSREAAV